MERTGGASDRAALRVRGGNRYHFPFDQVSAYASYFWLLRFSAGARRALEVGCATGFFSRHLVDQGIEVTGVEIDPVMADEARSVCQRVIVGNIELPSVQTQIRGFFDLVVLSDILEHLQQPGSLLRRVRQDWLTSDGRVVISLPNTAHWIVRREVLLGRFPYRRYGLFDRTHLRFYTYASMRRLICESGYRIERQAITVNANNLDDLTFAVLAPLYRQHRLRQVLVRLEYHLARFLPRLFAYQFVMALRPEGERSGA
jgi:SAM-dependent methyltransferase